MKTPRAQLQQGLLFLLLAQTMVGINIVCSKILLSAIPILLMLTIRFILATTILLPLHWLTPARKIPLRIHFGLCSLPGQCLANN